METSAGLILCSELERLQRITPTEAETLRCNLSNLQDQCCDAREKEKALLKVVRRQQNDALSERLRAERACESLNIEVRQLDVLNAEREQRQEQLNDFEQKLAVSQHNKSELERTEAQLVVAFDDMCKENDMLVKPELTKLQKDLVVTQEIFKRGQTVHENDSRRKQALLAKCEVLDGDKRSCILRLQDAKELLQKTIIEPERIRKQAECVQKAIEKLKHEMWSIIEKNKNHHDESKRRETKQKEADKVRQNLLHKLELHRDTITHRQRDVDAVKKNVEIEKARTHQLAEARVKLEMDRKAMGDRIRHETDGISMIRKELDMLRRRYRKKEAIANAANEVIPALKLRLADNEHLLQSHIEDNKLSKASIRSTKEEVDMAIARLLRQEVIEKAKRQRLESLLKDVAHMEDEISIWSAEERRQNKLLAVLSAQREMKAREATRAEGAEKDAQEQVRVKELVILDLSKKCSEVNNRLKEFSALYDVVKNERNKYVSLIQSSSQALAEMKEKIKILMNEVEILRNESFAKDKALAKEHSQHLASQTQRDGLRLDLYKSQSEYRRKQEMVEQKIVEIDKLNSIISSLERDMLRSKANYMKAIEIRNATGVTLIDRNDELCILYEKVNLQEQTMKSGELGIRKKHEDIRMLKLKLVELQRRVVVSRKQLPQMPTLVDTVLRLKSELTLEHGTLDSLCRQLESPSNSERWRGLSGDDPEREQLLAKTAVLEERLNLKREALLETELVLEEISNLTTKLRLRAAEQRESALRNTRRVNDLQARIRDTNRRMMAMVSELSMYQATAMKLQQQKRIATINLEHVKWRATHDEAPTDDIIDGVVRRQRMVDAKPHSQSNRQAGPARTTAEPRPNAYIPDVTQGLGIPKPYSSMAPFKPTEAGSTMRHYRNPQPPDISF